MKLERTYEVRLNFKGEIWREAEKKEKKKKFVVQIFRLMCKKESNVSFALQSLPSL